MAPPSPAATAAAAVSSSSSSSVAWERAYGAFLGVLCGDAAGATLEFSCVPITPALADEAMRMPGGGIFRVGPGQITDDSELALSLARSLVGHAPAHGLPVDTIAREYRRWFDSEPYDIGNTCAEAFGGVRPPSDDTAPAAGYGEAMIAHAAQHNSASEANGSLMRILPVAIWAATSETPLLVAAARREAELSHPSVVTQDCNAIYCLLVAHLLRHPGDSAGALAVGEAFARDHAHPTVRQWLLVESQDITGLDCTRQIGHVRWGFVLAVHFLRRRETYETAIRETLVHGGDTDTNAAIVGGLLGALHGDEGIPEFMKVPVLAFDCAAASGRGLGRRRPATYRSAQIAELTRALLGEAS